MDRTKRIKLIAGLLIATQYFSTVKADDYLFVYDTSYHTKYQEVSKPRVISIGLRLIELKKHKNILPSDIFYNEVMSYSHEEPFGDKHGRSTNVHETVHGINAWIRNTYKQKYKKNINGFYAGSGRGVLVENPPLTIRDIIPFIPECVRGYRYNLYFVKQLGDWNEVPTYPIDEWSAYISGAECAVDDAIRNLKNKEKSDAVSGALEFSIYCSALALATKTRCKDYWETNEQFRNVINYYLIKSEKVFSEGRDFFPSEKQDTLLLNLREKSETKELREFLLEYFDGIFVD
jgi:hypothetical protein